MKLLTTALLAMFAKSITSIPLQQVNDYTYELVSPAPGFTIDVASQLYIIMCQDLNFGPPCDGGYVAPGLCYGTPPFGVTSVQPSQDASGCTLYESTQCDITEPHVSDVAYPGITNLVNNGLNDKIKSFICY